jgi:hypothetical protein
MARGNARRSPRWMLRCDGVEVRVSPLHLRRQEAPKAYCQCHLTTSGTAIYREVDVRRHNECLAEFYLERLRRWWALLVVAEPEIRSHQNRQVWRNPPLTAKPVSLGPQPGARPRRIASSANSSPECPPPFPAIMPSPWSSIVGYRAGQTHHVSLRQS